MIISEEKWSPFIIKVTPKGYKVIEIKNRIKREVYESDISQEYKLNEDNLNKYFISRGYHKNLSDAIVHIALKKIFSENRVLSLIELSLEIVKYSLQ